MLSRLGINGEERGDRRYAPCLLCTPPALAHPRARPARAAQQPPCSATPHTDRKLPNRPSSLAVRMFCTVLFCAKERSRRLHQVRIQTAYVSRHASRRNVTTHCICTLHVLIQEQRNRRGKELTELLWREWNDTEKSKAKYKDKTATETKITAKLTARDASQTCCLGRAVNTRDVTLWLWARLRRGGYSTSAAPEDLSGDEASDVVAFNIRSLTRRPPHRPAACPRWPKTTRFRSRTIRRPSSWRAGARGLRRGGPRRWLV